MKQIAFFQKTTAVTLKYQKMLMNMLRMAQLPKYLFISVLLSWCTLEGQISNEDSRIETTSVSGSYKLIWQSKVNRVYFIQTSDENLLNWYYIPEIRVGNGEYLQYSFTSNASRIFYRLRYTDQISENPETADFDGDGVSNIDEVQSGLDPFSLDTDNDSLSDFIEFTLGISVDRKTDSDGDGVADGVDAYPSDPNRSVYTGGYSFQIITPGSSSFVP